MVWVVFSYGPSCLNIRADLSQSELSGISYKIDNFDYSCDKVMKFEFFYEK